MVNKDKEKEREKVDENKFIYNKFAMGPRNIKNITDKGNNLGLFVKVLRVSLQYKL